MPKNKKYQIKAQTSFLGLIKKKIAFSHIVVKHMFLDVNTDVGYIKKIICKSDTCQKCQHTVTEQQARTT